METQMGSPPPWQILDLVAHHLDPQTLAAACCVSRKWSTAMSSDHLWQPLCAGAYPSLSALRHPTDTPYRKLYSLGRTAECRRRRLPQKPQLSLADVLFAIDIRRGDECVATMVKRGADLERVEVFRFDFDVDAAAESKEEEVVRVAWHVAAEGMKGLFTAMECEGKVGGLEGWFSKELPAAGAGCGGRSGVVAEMRVGMDRVSVGMLNVVSWRYVGVEDALRYLQHFLLP